MKTLKTTRPFMVAVSTAIATLLVSGVSNATTPPTSSSAITAAELVQNGYSYPTDLKANANSTELANYAWRLFIASMQSTKATLTTNLSDRTTASSTSNFIDTGTSAVSPNPLVFEGMYHRTEAYPYYTSGNQPASPIGKAPTYYFSPYGGSAYTVTGANYVNLDESNEIGQNMMYYRNSTTPDFPVLYMAKVNATETTYAYSQTTKPSHSNMWEFPDGVIETKSAWRKISSFSNPADANKYHQATATWYEAPVSPATQPTAKSSETFALIGIHIIRKTANYPEYIFTSFEHVDAVSRDRSGITDPAYDLSYTTLAYGSGDPTTAKVTGAYSVNAPGLPAASNSKTTYTLPAAGAVAAGYVTVTQPKTITKEVNDVNNTVNALILAAPNGSSSVWANYRLKGAQAVLTNDTKTNDFYLANIVIESSQPGVQLFQGGVNGPTASGTFTNYRKGSIFVQQPAGSGKYNLLPYNVSASGGNYLMGGCKGCHGVAQQKGRDFAFVAGGALGSGHGVDTEAHPAMTPAQIDAHNKAMMETTGYQ